MGNNEAKALVEKYKSGTLNQAEQRMLEDCYLKLSGSKELNLEDGELDRNLDEIWETISLNTTVTRHKTFVLWKRVAAAAAVLLVTVGGLYFYTQKQNNGVQSLQSDATAIQAGGNRATLTLANGKVIALDDAANGKIAEQEGITITKTKDGQVVYTINDAIAGDAKEIINTISTPMGGQYRVHLPDGSSVWLNAGSSLRYPVRFLGAERKVTLTGEAYFEVEKNISKVKNIPFIVLTDKQEVTVLGTHFNINAYTDEPIIKTTLIEGAVKVNRVGAPGDAVLLKPGQQSSMAAGKLSVSFVNTEEAIAWKNGVFLFNDADLKTVMRSIARWYDVEVLYEGELPNKEFSGDIYRNLNLNQVLDVLSFYKVHFRVEGRKIIVTP
jgi:ferric-dicitrate binding protein FerR (iron transport regulator)